MKNLVNSDDKLFKLRLDLGPAVWLLMLYWHFQEGFLAWGSVANGVTIRDAEMAPYLGVSVFTAARWREKLRDVGAIQLVRCPGGFRVYAYRPRFAIGIERSFYEADSGESAAVDGKWPELATTTIQ